ncbi:MAG: hypothetical protein PHO41_09250 [Eubacteriales bacterium]|nr:hypothetical protein [Eubacteriales bacterium]
MSITNYLNQTCSWYGKTGNNSYGEPTYGAGASIDCRWEDKRKLVRNAQGVEITSVATAYTTSNIQENDKLTYSGRDYIVLMVADQPWLDGTINHREVYL